MPAPDIYEEEYKYLPWGRLIDWVVDWVAECVGADSGVLDYMCGTGYLLRQLRHVRPLLRLAGCDLSAAYIEYGAGRCSDALFAACDAFEYAPPFQPDIVTCTAGIHHLPFHDQAVFLDKLADELRPDGYLILGEILVRDDSRPEMRQRSVIELGAAVLQYAVGQSAPAGVLGAGMQVMENDLLLRGEYKRSLASLSEIVGQRFHVREVVHTWPTGESASEEFGDFVFVCSPK